MHNMKLNGQKMKDEYNTAPLNYPFFNSSYARCIFGMYSEITYKPHAQLLYKGSSWLEKKDGGEDYNRSSSWFCLFAFF